MQLFHGSNVTVLPTIIREGLDMRVSSLGGAIGAGIYFAVQARTSLSYVQGVTPQNPPQMLLCRVAIGSVTRGKSGLRRPPEKHGFPGMLYDSVDGMLGGDKMYAIFDHKQSYPEYIIHYAYTNITAPINNFGGIGGLNFPAFNPTMASGFSPNWVTSFANTQFPNQNPPPGL